MLIKIARDTVRKNPNAGNTFSMVGTARDVQFSYTGDKDLKFLNHLSDVVVTSHGCNENLVYFYEGLIINPNNTKLIDNLSKYGVTFTISQTLQKMHHAPDLEYLYAYEDTPITCSSCGETFNHSELDADEIADSYCDTICPKCGKWYCCDDIRYEKISDVVKEMNL